MRFYLDGLDLGTDPVQSSPNRSLLTSKPDKSSQVAALTRAIKSLTSSLDLDKS